MTLHNEGNVSLLDPFAHTKQDRDEIRKFDFIRAEQKEGKKPVSIEETHCTVVTVGGKFLEKKTFKKVMKRIDNIRKLIKKYFNILLPDVFF